MSAYVECHICGWRSYTLLSLSMCPACPPSVDHPNRSTT